MSDATMNTEAVKAKSAENDDALIFDSHGGLPRLRAIMARLRDPEHGCPWDIAQDFASIAPHAIEEAHEVMDAVQRQAWDELRDELGDLLFQPVFQAQLAQEAGFFDLDDVIRAVGDKMVARHPHIFGDDSRDKTAAQQVADWEKLKERERGKARVLDGVARGLPGLSRALKLQNRAARVGFDWPSTDEVLDKLREEMAELCEARDRLGPQEVAEEFGDMLFVMANLARHMQVDPELALHAASEKFTRRFAYIEDSLAESGKTPAQSNLAEMDALWDKAKAREKTAARGEA